MRIAIFSDHARFSKMNSSIHFISKALAALGNEVCFVTTSYSLSSVIKGDFRREVRRKDGYKRTDGLETAIIPRRLTHMQNFHNNLINAILDYTLYYIDVLLWKTPRQLGKVDLILIESGLGVAYHHKIQRRYPDAAYIYIVNDDPETIKAHPRVLRADRRLASMVKTIIVSDGLEARYPGSTLVKHGIDISAFDEETISPFTAPVNAIAVGNMLYDDDLIQFLAGEFPSIEFHVIGPEKRPGPSNTTYYGQMRFEETVPYIKHASVGIAAYKRAPGIEYISMSSLKLKQYRFAGLPIVCPDFASNGLPNYFSFDSADRSSAAKALRSALGFVKARSDEIFRDWATVTSEILSVASMS